jgi:translation initiation factor IF-2
MTGAPKIAPPIGAVRSGTPGPLHRTGGSGGASGPLQPRPGQPSNLAPIRPPGLNSSEPRPNPTSPPPLRQSDYMTSAGTRVQPGARPPLQQPARPPLERSSSGPSGEGPRYGGSGTTMPRRPLPPVAGPTSGPQIRRPPGAPQAGGDRQGPELRGAQRPDMKFTPDQLRAMRESGQMGSMVTPPGRPGAPGTSRPGQPGMGRPGMPPMPAGRGPGFAGAPPIGIRRPPLAPGLPVAPVAPTTEEDEDRKGKGLPGSRLGTAADRNARRTKRNERANERKSFSPQPASALLSESEEDAKRGRSGGRGRGKGNQRGMMAPTRRSTAEIQPPLSVRNLSEVMGVKANDLIKRMMTSMNMLVQINATLDEESAVMLALEFGVELTVVHPRTAEDDMLDSMAPTEAGSETLMPRPPIVTILGHVDHGKTSLLDKIRKANVVDSESGGITQHIGAYTVVQDGKSTTFVDTPGHEAFTAMRARGANVTDIVVLVVAADDGVMPQTQEAIAHAKAAGVPIIVALNKIDLPNVNLNKIYGELSQQDLVPEEYGGDTPIVKTSALTGQGIPDLLEMISIMAELREFKSDPNRPATGTCLESSISEGRGVVATVLVQDGTLKVGDVMVCGDGFGRVRAIFDDKGKSLEEAGPSTPVEVSGLDEVPTAGEKFAVINDITRAREVAETRRTRTRGVSLGERQAITLENLYSKMAEQKIKSLNLILKADVQGSLEALIKELEKLHNDEVPIRILHKGVGGISESDILLADASQAIVIGFRVAPEDKAMSEAAEKKIDIRRYDIIYQVTDEIKKAIEGMLVPEIKEVHLGRAVVRMTYRISKVGMVAGCFVTQGSIERSSKARIIREGREIYKGGVEALKRFKDDAKEVREGFECGIKVTNFEDLKVDDVIEAYRIDIIRRTL